METVDLAPLAAVLAPRSAEVVGALMKTLLGQIEELRGDEQVAERLRASVESNVSTLLYLFEQPTDVHLLNPPPGAVQWSLQLAQRDIALSLLWRAYHLCTWRYLLICIEELTKLSGSAAELGPKIAAASTLVYTYVDHVCELIGTTYELERQSWRSQRDAVRAERIADLLAGRVGDLHGTEAALGYRLRRRHLGLILWDSAPADGTESIRMQRLVSRWADAIHCPDRPLVVPRDRSTVWAWLPVTAETDTDFVRTLTTTLTAGGSETLRGAVGDVVFGAEGFARTHRQAGVAQSVALVAGSCAARVTPYGEVAGLSFLCENLDRAREWVQDTLGPLAIDDEPSARLRETVSAFLETGGSLNGAAERLGCHKNTVQYRIRRAEETLGRPVRERRVDLELALQASRWLGTAVLSAPATS